MSHQSGITGGQDLDDVFSRSRDSEEVRIIKVTIENEVLIPAAVLDTASDWSSDYEAMVPGLLEEKTACYLLIRLDSKNASGFDWVLVSYAPDFAHVREKMLYASTRATLKTLFGLIYIKEELFGTVPEDVNLEGYEKHLVAEAAPPPLTMEEVEKAEIRQLETGSNIGTSTRHQVATGVHFPVANDAQDQLEACRDGKLTYVQLSLDTEAEVINLERAETIGADEIAALVPTDHARFHVFNFKHSHEGDHIESFVFVYSCPGYACGVKERMLYSTCKSTLLDYLKHLGFEFAKKIEIGEPSEISQDELYEHLHPPKQVFKQKFARPAPPGRGTRRPSRPSRQSRE